MSNTGDKKNGGIAFSLVRQFGRRPPPTLETAVEDSVTTFRAISGDHFDEEEHRKRAQAGVSRSFTPAGVARQTAAIAGSPDRTARLGNVTVPSLVIHGLQDPLVKPSGGIATAKAIPGSRLLMFGDMGHDLPRPRWLEIRDAILQNIRRA
ncbi:MAG: alpha/beta hydrolase [Actinomycetota bacterium]